MGLDQRGKDKLPAIGGKHQTQWSLEGVRERDEASIAVAGVRHDDSEMAVLRAETPQGLTVSGPSQARKHAHHVP